MIRYTLKCIDDHQFESWFQSASAFDTLKKTGHLACAVCGSTEVEKTVMAPRITKASLSEPASVAEQTIQKMKAHVEANSEDVGDKFAEEARAMHEGVSPERSIYGQAKPTEAKALIDDGIPVLPLPFRPKTKTN